MEVLSPGNKVEYPDRDIEEMNITIFSLAMLVKTIKIFNFLYKKK